MRKSEFEKYKNDFYLVPDAFIVNVPMYDNMRQKVIRASEGIDFFKRPPLRDGVVLKAVAFTQLITRKTFRVGSWYGFQNYIQIWLMHVL